MALDPRVTVPWGMVRCADCGREYRCTPTDDHYLRAGDPEDAGRVCTRCLVSKAVSDTATTSLADRAATTVIGAVSDE